MAEKTISSAGLLELAKGGARIKTEQQPMVIEQFGELIEAFKNMIAAQELRATADLKRSQTQLEVLAVLQSQIKQQGGVNRSPPLDLKPLETVLSEIQQANNQREAHDYEFTFDRNTHGFATKIHAKVIRPTLN